MIIELCGVVMFMFGLEREIFVFLVLFKEDKLIIEF